MATFIPDTVDGSTLEVEKLVARKVRGGIVTNLSGDPSTALDTCLTADGMPAMGTVITVNGVTLYLRRLAVSAVGPDSARVQLTYDNDFSGQSTAYIITDRSYLSAYTTNKVPGLGTPIRTAPFTFTNGATAIPADNVMMTIQRPLREVTVSGIKTGNPPVNFYQSQIGKVNNAPWYGSPRAYFLLTAGSVEQSRYAGFYAYQLSALTRCTEDWRETGILRNSVTGRWVPIDDDNIQHLMNIPYAYGLMDTANGGVAIGPYDLTNFPALFGF